MTEDPFDPKTHQRWVNENWKLDNSSIGLRAILLVGATLGLGVLGIGLYTLHQEKTLPERMNQLYGQYDHSRDELTVFRDSQRDILDQITFKREYNKRSRSAQDIWDKMCEMDDGTTLNRLASQSKYYGVCKK